jgi:hypothetical protein
VNGLDIELSLSSFEMDTSFTVLPEQITSKSVSAAMTFETKEPDTTNNIAINIK